MTRESICRRRKQPITVKPPVALLRLDDVAVQRDGVQVRQRRQDVHLRHDEDGVGVQVQHAQLTQLAQHLQPREGEAAVGQGSEVSQV